MDHEVLSKVVQSGGKLRVLSALNPILWFAGMIGLPMVGFSLFAEKAPDWMLMFSCTLIASPMIGFIFLLLFDRDKLQSEHFQIQKLVMTAEQKGMPAVEIRTVDVVPDPKALPSNEEGSQ